MCPPPADVQLVPFLAYPGLPADSLCWSGCRGPHNSLLNLASWTEYLGEAWFLLAKVLWLCFSGHVELCPFLLEFRHTLRCHLKIFFVSLLISMDYHLKLLHRILKHTSEIAEVHASFVLKCDTHMCVEPCWQ